MTVVRQPSFSGGVLSPTVHGRDDLEQYASGLRTCKNFFISKHGAAVSRPGMKFLGSAKTGATDVRLIPFYYSDSISYVLEFGIASSTGYLRFWLNGAQITSGGSPYEIASPFNTLLAYIRFVQSGDVLFCTHPLYAAQELRRTNDTSWAFTAATIGLVAYSTAGGETPRLDSTTAANTEDGTHPAKDWTYKLTVLYEDVASGQYRESAATQPAKLTTLAAPHIDGASIPDELVISPDLPQILYFARSTAAPVSTTYRPIATRVYRGRGNVFGYIGETAGRSDRSDTYPAGTLSNFRFRDYGDDPDYTLPPPEGRDPFLIRNSAGTTTATERPGAIGFFEQRLVLAGTLYRAQRIYLSATDSYWNFDKRLIPTADAAIELEIASRKRERIQHVLGLDRLLVFTDQSVWSVAGSSGAIKPTELIEARLQSTEGANLRPPLVIDGTVLYVSRSDSRVRDLAYEHERRSYVGADVSFLARHLLDGRQITDWTYAEAPWGIVWCVLDDGTMLSLTYDRRLGLWAWAQHETDGDVESVCAVPYTGGEDMVYLAVTRNGAIRIERFATRVVDDAADAICLDGAISTSISAGSGTITSTSLYHLIGKNVYVLADGAVHGPFPVTVPSPFVANQGTVATGITDAVTDLHVGLRYDCDLELLDVPARERQKVIKRVLWDVEASRGLFTGTELPAANTTTGLDEWQQRQVSDSYDPLDLYTGQVEVRISGDYARTGRAVLRQFDPLPLTVLGVTRDGDVGG